MTGPGGYLVSYGYTNGLLSAVTGPAGLGEKYQYQNTANPLLLTRVNDLAGALQETITYDSSFKVTRVAGPSNFRVSTLTDNLDNTRTLVDPRRVARTYTYEYKSGYKPTYVMAPNGAAETSQYDEEGRLISHLDFTGKSMQLVYDNTGTQITESDSNGLVTTRTLDANWKNLLSVTTPVNQTTFTYDSRGNLLTKTKTVEGVSQSWVYTYDSVGRLTSFTHPKTGKTSYTYDASGALTKITNALNHSWTITQNDPHGRPLSITTPSGEVATYLYDAAGRLTQQTLTYPDKSNHATVFTYTSRGKLATITRPDGYVTTFTYNVADFLTAITDSLGNKIAYTLEGAGRPLSATYTQQGVVISKQNYTYDTLTGEIASVTDGLGKKTTYAYDASGRVIQETDALNRQKFYQHYVLGSALEYYYSGTNPNFVSGGRVDFTYDVLGSLTNIRTPDAQETLYTVDGFGLVKNRQSGSTGQDQYLYYANGLLKTRTDAKGNATNYSYDALGRLTALAYSDGQNTTYTYDTLRVGALSSITGGGATLNYTYTPEGFVKTVSQVAGTLTKTLDYTWDASGKIISLVTPSGQTIGFSYPPQGTQPSSVTLNGTNLISQVTWLPFSAHPSGWLWVNGVAHQRLVDLAGRTQKVETLGVLSRTLTRDAVGNPVKITDAQNAARTQTLTYNFLDSLLTEKTGSGRNDRFGYDLNHNRASLIKDSTGTNAYSYGYTGSQLTSVMHNTTYATNSLAYDATGNLIQDSTRTFNYDARQRVSSMTKNNKTTQYYYNGLGQRFSKNGIVYMYDLQGHLIGEYTNTGALIQETVWLNDLPIATIRPNGTGISVYFVHADELGTPRVVTDTAQKPVWRWDGDAFGRGLPNQDPLKTGVKFVYHLRYPGQYYDIESGLHYNYFRDYDPETGRYIQSDPIGLAGGFNTYAYVGNSPVKYVDPRGLDATATAGIWGLRALGLSALAIPGAGPVGIALLGLSLSGDIANNSMYAKPKPGSKPKNCPPGTIPIDQVPGLDKDDVHKIKKGVGAGPPDWTGIDKDGNVWTGDSNGEGVNHGDYGGFLPR